MHIFYSVKRRPVIISVNPAGGGYLPGYCGVPRKIQLSGAGKYRADVLPLRRRNDQEQILLIGS